jgi:hypothetical protein
LCLKKVEHVLEDALFCESRWKIDLQDIEIGYREDEIWKGNGNGEYGIWNMEYVLWWERRRRREGRD